MRLLSHEVLWSAIRSRIALLQAVANNSPVSVPPRRTKRREDAHALHSSAIAGRNEIFRALIR